MRDQCRVVSKRERRKRTGSGWGIGHRSLQQSKSVLVRFSCCTVKADIHGHQKPLSGIREEARYVENSIPATDLSQQRILIQRHWDLEDIPVTNLKGLVTRPPSSSGSGISMSGIFAVGCAICREGEIGTSE